MAKFNEQVIGTDKETFQGATRFTCVCWIHYTLTSKQTWVYLKPPLFIPVSENQKAKVHDILFNPL